MWPTIRASVVPNGSLAAYLATAENGLSSKARISSNVLLMVVTSL